MNKQLKKDPHEGMILNSITNKDLLSEIRDSDYHHPGEEEAIHLLFKDVEKKESKFFLDVGCGYGGTANFIHSNGWGKVVGLDINQDVINRANQKYGAEEKDFHCFYSKNMKPIFLCCDANDALEKISDKLQSKPIFDVIFLFNSLFLIPDQVKVLKNLSSLANKKTVLLVYDYADYGAYAKASHSENGIRFLPNPIPFDGVEEIFVEAGWQPQYVKNIDKIYIKSYEDLIVKIKKKLNNLIKLPGDTEKIKLVEQLFLRYEHILNALHGKAITGLVISATLKN